MNPFKIKNTLKTHTLKALIAGFLLTSLTTAFASDVNDKNNDQPSDKALSPKRKTWLYIGGNLGLTFLRPSDAQKNLSDPNLREVDFNTLHLDIKLLASKYWEDWVADIGGGYLYNKGSIDNPFAGLSLIEMSTRAGFVEFSPRYRLSTSWQLGPVVNALFGTDVSFDQAKNPVGQVFSVLAGLRLNWESQGEDSRWRIGGELKKDFTISEREVWMGLLDIQWGFPLGGDTEEKPLATPIVERAPEPLPVVPVQEYKPTPVEAPKFAEVGGDRSVKIYLGEAVLRFKTAKADLKPSSDKILKLVTGYMNQFPKAWQTVRVEGHTDERGKLAYNDRLSERRANTVAKKLIAMKIPRSRMKIKGFGPRHPISEEHNEKAWGLNRRVELWLDGVADPDAITKDLNDLASSLNFDTGKSN